MTKNNCRSQQIHRFIRKNGLLAAHHHISLPTEYRFRFTLSHVKLSPMPFAGPSCRHCDERPACSGDCCLSICITGMQFSIALFCRRLFCRRFRSAVLACLDLLLNSRERKTLRGAEPHVQPVAFKAGKREGPLANERSNKVSTPLRHNISLITAFGSVGLARQNRQLHRGSTTRIASEA